MPPVSFRAIVRRGYRDLEILRSECDTKRPRIDARLAEFRDVGRKDDKRLFEELCFCILAVQSKARPSDAAVAALREQGLLWSGRRPEIASFLRHRTPFHNHKAAFIVRARDRFFPDGDAVLSTTLALFGSSKVARDRLVRDADGLGLKEASHVHWNTSRRQVPADPVR